MICGLSRCLVLVIGLGTNACANFSRTTSSLPAGAVAFRYTRSGGEIDSLGRHRGKLVLVSVFATWARPALLEVPIYQDLLRQFGDQELVIIQLAVDQEPQALDVYVETFDVKHFVGWPMDIAAFISKSGPLGPIGVLPTSVLIGRGGRIVLRSDGIWDRKILNKAIHRLLAADSPSD